MLDSPARGIMFSFPSSTATYRVQCSFCDHESWATPDRIKPENMPKWQSHTCKKYECNGFTCMKHYVETGGNEFYVANNKHLMCYRCKKLDGSNTYQLRPFDKLPKNAEIYSKPGDFIRTKTTEWYKVNFPSKFENVDSAVLNLEDLCRGTIKKALNGKSPNLLPLPASLKNDLK